MTEFGDAILIQFSYMGKMVLTLLLVCGTLGILGMMIVLLRGDQKIRDMHVKKLRRVRIDAEQWIARFYKSPGVDITVPLAEVMDRYSGNAHVKCIGKTAYIGAMTLEDDTELDTETKIDITERLLELGMEDVIYDRRNRGGAPREVRRKLKIPRRRADDQAETTEE